MPINYDECIAEIQQQDNLARSAPSVISDYHPANSDNHNNSHAAPPTYTFRQREMKLNFTLGWEMEANHVPTRVPEGITQTEDGSVNGDGAEFVVLPAITKSPRYVLSLLKDLVHSPKLNTDDSCGFHVHVSASNLHSLPRMRQWAIATEYLAEQIEEKAFEAVPDSRADNQYCKPITLLENGQIFLFGKYSNSRRYHWLNTVEMFRPGGIRTIENRLLGHTHRWKYVLAWSLFTMELARRGWELSNHPFQVDDHKEKLTIMLDHIREEIKPLSKRNEPIPEWVYRGLKPFGIDETAFNRPLARLTETEANVRGITVPYYNDNQPELDNDEEEEDDNYCPCGCGEQGRCPSQEHNDADCDGDECAHCHEEENCGSRCYYCRQNAHENDENCRQTGCALCFRERHQRITSVVSVAPNVSLIPLTQVVIDASELYPPYRLVTYADFDNPITNICLASEEHADYILDPHEEALSIARQMEVQ